MSVTLYLMSKKGYEVLHSLVTNNFKKHITEVIIGRDKSVLNDYSENIISLCKTHALIYFERNDTYSITSDFSIAISWRWLIKSNSSKLIILHDSLLPKYRGFAPLVNMLINQEKEIGVSAIFASEEYDKGDLITQSSTKIEYPIKISKAIDLITINYIEVVTEIMEKIKQKDTIIANKQNEELASYSLWRDEDDYSINWEQSAVSILNFINAVSSPYLGASTYINGSQKIRILEAELEKDVVIENRDVGKIIFIKNNHPVIVCKTGLIKLINVIDDETKQNILPFKKFRIKFTDKKK
ncbi:formyltransferase family protein [uncultured Aquimarina sp.]|uniref:formyltransferase family protein n=1 Tax=uncultured Aquimarina sp. TaxID=575652 RepID=UPI002637E4B3|nr:formyltransferase family protein [uncultured Aquimarina sp.]